MKPSTPAAIRNLRRFGFAFGTAITILGSLLWWREKAAAPWILGLAATVLLAALIAPRVLWPLEKLLSTLLRALMVAVTYVVLVFSYIFVFTPIGWLLKLMGKDLLELRFPGEQTTYWVPVESDGPATRPDKPY